MSGQYASYPVPSGGGGSGVSSLNTLTGALTLAAGSGITITPSGGNTLTIASTGGGGSGTVTSVAFSDTTGLFTVSGSPITSSGTISLSGLQSQTANHFFAAPNGSSGAPTFRSIVAADIPTLNQNTTGTASNITATSNSTLTTLSSLSLPYSQITGAPAAITALTGDATASGPGSAALTLATVNGSPGSFGSASSSLTATVNGKGLITSLASQSIQIAESQVTNLVSDLAGKQPVGNYITALTGDVVASGPGSSASTIQPNVVSNSKLAQMPTLTIKGNNTGSTANASDLTVAQVNAILPVFTSSLNGLVPSSGGGTSNFLRADGTWDAPSGTGTVTSVAFSDASTTPIYNISGSPVTTSGTLTQTLTTQSANLVFAGPSSGSAAQPSFRSLVSNDIPSLSAIYLPLSGGTMSGAINMGSNQIHSLATPSVSSDAATKGYVDAAISGLTWEGPAKAYANSNVPLTGGASLTIDGYSVQNGDLVILGNQTTASQNGEYTASGIGTAYTLTSNGLPSQAGQAWLITNGTVYSDSAFVSNAAIPSATFTEFAGPTSYSFTAPLSLSGNTVSISQASTSTNGYLSSTDWNTFNNKQAAGNYITALTGDATASGPGSAALTLATVNSNTGSFGSSTSIPSFTVNGKGLITAASGNAVVAPAGTLSGTTLNSSVVSSSLTSVGTITSGTWNGTTIAIANGGTGQTSASNAFIALSPLTTAGDIIYENSTPTPARLAIGSSGNVLTVVSGLPSWQPPATSGTVTSVSVVSANGLAGTVATSTSTPAITLSTTITGVLKGNGTAISAATAGTDYVIPSGNITGTAANITATSNSTLTTLSALSLPTTQLSGTISLTSQVSGVLPIANGGTDNGSLSVTAGGVIYTDGTKFQNVGAGSSGQILQSNGTSAPTWVNNTASSIAYTPVFQSLTSGSSTYNLNYNFITSSCNATAGATYTNNGVTFTVINTVSSSLTVVMSGSSAPTSSGTLTKASGTGDSTITFSSVKTPLYLRVIAIGGGGGGGGLSGAGGSGGNTTFGSSLITANGGAGAATGNTPGAGGTASISSPAVGLPVQGSYGAPAGSPAANSSGGDGGASAIGGAGSGGYDTINGNSGATNSGSGGGGSGGNSGNEGSGGGGAGGYANAFIYSPSATYSYAVGSSGSGGTGTITGGAGGAGIITIETYWQ